MKPMGIKLVNQPAARSAITQVLSKSLLAPTKPLVDTPRHTPVSLFSTLFSDELCQIELAYAGVDVHAVATGDTGAEPDLVDCTPCQYGPGRVRGQDLYVKRNHYDGC